MKTTTGRIIVLFEIIDKIHEIRKVGLKESTNNKITFVVLTTDLNYKVIDRKERLILDLDTYKSQAGREVLNTEFAIQTRHKGLSL
jgi:hypothetical protein